MKHRKRRRFRRRIQAEMQSAEQSRLTRGPSPLVGLLGLVPLIRAFHDAHAPYRRLNAIDEVMQETARINREAACRPLTSQEACERMGLDPGTLGAISEVSSPELTYSQCRDLVQQLSIDRVVRRTLRAIGVPYVPCGPARPRLICFDDLQPDRLEHPSASLNVPAGLLNDLQGVSYASGRVALAQWKEEKWYQ